LARFETRVDGAATRGIKKGRGIASVHHAERIVDLWTRNSLEHSETLRNFY
jgi:hypothetical protein